MVGTSVGLIVRMVGTLEIVIPVLSIRQYQTVVILITSPIPVRLGVGQTQLVHFHVLQRCKNVARHSTGYCFLMVLHSSNTDDTLDLLNILHENGDLIYMGYRNGKFYCRFFG